MFRLRPRRLLSKQLAAHLTVLVTVAGLWFGTGAYFLRKINVAVDTRIAATALLHEVVDARRHGEALLGDDFIDPLYVNGEPVPRLLRHIEAMQAADREIGTLIERRPDQQAAWDRLRVDLRKYGSDFHRVVLLREGHAGRQIRPEGPASLVMEQLRAELSASAEDLEAAVRAAVAETREAAQTAWRGLRWVSAFILALGLLLGSVVAYVFARSISRPIVNLGRAAAEIGHGRLDVPVEIEGTDEIGDLALALETMARDLRVAWQRFENVAKATQDVVWDWDIGRGTFWVSSSIETLGYRGEAGTHEIGWYVDRVHPDDRARVRASAQEAMGGASLMTEEYRFRRADGSYADILDRGHVLRDEFGVPVRMIGSMMDLSERKQAEAEMRRAREAAEAASRAKSEFLAHMSHEIRTPMNAIIGMGEILLASRLEADQRECVNTMRESADALLDVIDAILDFSKVEAGRIEMEEQPFDLEDLLGSVLRTLAVRAHQKGLELALRRAPSVPDRVTGDAAHLRQVLVNLVGNAIKFTDRGEVILSVEPGSDGADRIELRFHVSDTGIGVPTEQRVAIFEPFVQADSSTTRRFGGTGLGLAISARFVALMGGTIAVAERAGGGSVFTFTARFGRAPEAQPHSDLLPAELQGRRVLVVDDNAENRRILADMLTSWGLVPTAAASAEEARGAIAQSRERGLPFAIALIDSHMPGTDGFAFASELHQQSWEGVTVLMLSAGWASAADRCAKAGVSWHLVKPIPPSALLELIERVLGSALPVPAHHEVPLEAPARALDVLVAEDNRVNQRVIQRALESRGHHVVLAANGREALAAYRAGGPWDAVLMDVQMPELDGFGATAAIRELERGSGRRTLVIALTAHALREDRERCFAAGMDAYLSKPVRFPELFATLENGNHGAPAAAGPVKSPGEAPFDAAAVLTEVAQGDKGLLRELAALFQEEAPRQLARARQALASGDRIEAAAAAHTLKGSASQLRAVAASQAAARVEAAVRAGETARVTAEMAVLEGEIARFCSALSCLLDEPA